MHSWIVTRTESHGVGLHSETEVRDVYASAAVHRRAAHHNRTRTGLRPFFIGTNTSASTGYKLGRQLKYISEMVVILLQFSIILIIQTCQKI